MSLTGHGQPALKTSITTEQAQKEAADTPMRGRESRTWLWRPSTTICSTFLEMIPLDMLVTTVQVGGTGIERHAEHERTVLSLLRIKGEWSADPEGFAVGKDIRSWGRAGSDLLQQTGGSVQDWVPCEVILESKSMALLGKASSFWLKVSRSSGFSKTNGRCPDRRPTDGDMGREEEAEAGLCNYRSGVTAAPWGLRREPALSHLHTSGF